MKTNKYSITYDAAQDKKEKRKKGCIRSDNNNNKIIKNLNKKRELNSKESKSVGFT